MARTRRSRSIPIALIPQNPKNVPVSCYRLRARVLPHCLIQGIHRGIREPPPREMPAIGIQSLSIILSLSIIRAAAALGALS